MLAIDGTDLRGRPLLERKERLAQVVEGVSHIHYVDHLEAQGEALFANVCELDFEGIVAKYADSAYQAGRRPTWLKIKNQNYTRQEALRFQ